MSKYFLWSWSFLFLALQFLEHFLKDMVINAYKFHYGWCLPYQMIFYLEYSINECYKDPACLKELNATKTVSLICLLISFSLHLCNFIKQNIVFILHCSLPDTLWNITWRISISSVPQVTAVGHAAMLAAIQRYVPALVRSFRPKTSFVGTLIQSLDLYISEVNNAFFCRFLPHMDQKGWIFCGSLRKSRNWKPMKWTPLKMWMN